MSIVQDSGGGTLNKFTSFTTSVVGRYLSLVFLCLTTLSTIGLAISTGILDSRYKLLRKGYIDQTNSLQQCLKEQQNIVVPDLQCDSMYVIKGVYQGNNYTRYVKFGLGNLNESEEIEGLENATIEAFSGTFPSDAKYYNTVDLYPDGSLVLGMKNASGQSVYSGDGVQWGLPYTQVGVDITVPIVITELDSSTGIRAKSIKSVKSGIVVEGDITTTDDTGIDVVGKISAGGDGIYVQYGVSSGEIGVHISGNLEAEESGLMVDSIVSKQGQAINIGGPITCGNSTTNITSNCVQMGDITSYSNSTIEKTYGSVNIGSIEAHNGFGVQVSSIDAQTYGVHVGGYVYMYEDPANNIAAVQIEGNIDSGIVPAIQVSTGTISCKETDNCVKLNDIIMNGGINATYINSIKMAEQSGSQSSPYATAIAVGSGISGFSQYGIQVSNNISSVNSGGDGIYVGQHINVYGYGVYVEKDLSSNGSDGVFIGGDLKANYNGLFVNSIIANGSNAIYVGNNITVSYPGGDSYGLFVTNGVNVTNGSAIQVGGKITCGNSINKTAVNCVSIGSINAELQVEEVFDDKQQLLEEKTFSAISIGSITSNSGTGIEVNGSIDAYIYGVHVGENVQMHNNPKGIASIQVDGNINSENLIAINVISGIISCSGTDNCVNLKDITLDGNGNGDSKAISVNSIKMAEQSNQPQYGTAIFVNNGISGFIQYGIQVGGAIQGHQNNGTGIDVNSISSTGNTAINVVSGIQSGNIEIGSAGVNGNIIVTGSVGNNPSSTAIQTGAVTGDINIASITGNINVGSIPQSTNTASTDSTDSNTPNLLTQQISNPEDIPLKAADGATIVQGSINVYGGIACSNNGPCVNIDGEIDGNITVEGVNGGSIKVNQNNNTSNTVSIGEIYVSGSVTNTFISGEATNVEFGECVTLTSNSITKINTRKITSLLNITHDTLVEGEVPTLINNIQVYGPEDTTPKLSITGITSKPFISSINVGDLTIKSVDSGSISEITLPNVSNDDGSVFIGTIQFDKPQSDGTKKSLIIGGIQKDFNIAQITTPGNITSGLDVNYIYSIKANTVGSAINGIVLNIGEIEGEVSLGNINCGKIGSTTNNNCVKIGNVESYISNTSSNSTISITSVKAYKPNSQAIVVGDIICGDETNKTSRACVQTGNIESFTNINTATPTLNVGKITSHDGYGAYINGITADDGGIQIMGDGITAKGNGTGGMAIQVDGTVYCGNNLTTETSTTSGGCISIGEVQAYLLDMIKDPQNTKAVVYISGGITATNFQALNVGGTIQCGDEYDNDTKSVINPGVNITDHCVSIGSVNAYLGNTSNNGNTIYYSAINVGGSISANTGSAINVSSQITCGAPAANPSLTNSNCVQMGDITIYGDTNANATQINSITTNVAGNGIYVKESVRASYGTNSVGINIGGSVEGTGDGIRAKHISSTYNGHAINVTTNVMAVNNNGDAIHVGGNISSNKGNGLYVGGNLLNEQPNTNDSETTVQGNIYVKGSVSGSVQVTGTVGGSTTQQAINIGGQITCGGNNPDTNCVSIASINAANNNGLNIQNITAGYDGIFVKDFINANGGTAISVGSYINTTYRALDIQGKTTCGTTQYGIGSGADCIHIGDVEAYAYEIYYQDVEGQEEEEEVTELYPAINIGAINSIKGDGITIASIDAENKGIDISGHVKTTDGNGVNVGTGINSGGNCISVGKDTSTGIALTSTGGRGVYINGKIDQRGIQVDGDIDVSDGYGIEVTGNITSNGGSDCIHVNTISATSDSVGIYADSITAETESAIKVNNIEVGDGNGIEVVNSVTVKSSSSIGVSVGSITSGEDNTIQPDAISVGSINVGGDGITVNGEITTGGYALSVSDVITCGDEGNAMTTSTNNDACVQIQQGITMYGVDNSQQVVKGAGSALQINADIEGTVDIENVEATVVQNEFSDRSPAAVTISSITATDGDGIWLNGDITGNDNGVYTSGINIKANTASIHVYGGELNQSVWFEETTIKGTQSNTQYPPQN